MKRFSISVIFLFALLISITYADDINNPNPSTLNVEPSHQLLGLVDETTGIGVPDARRVFPMIDNGAIFSVEDRDIGTVLVYRGLWTDPNGNEFDYYSHAKYVDPSSIFTNNYIFFYKNKDNVNVLRITDGTTNHYDIAFGKGPLPTNGIPVLTYSEVSGMVGDNNFVRISGISHYIGTIATNSISFDDVNFNREPNVSIQLRGKYNKLMSISCEAYTNKVDYYIVDANGPITDHVEVYWSAVGTIDEKSNKIPDEPEDGENEP